MAAVMATFTHDFATKWEMEAHIKRDLEDMERLQDQLIKLGMVSAELGVLANQKDKFRHTGVMRFKDIEAYKKCMEALRGHDWGTTSKKSATSSGRRSMRWLPK